MRNHGSMIDIIHDEIFETLHAKRTRCPLDDHTPVNTGCGGGPGGALKAGYSMLPSGEKRDVPASALLPGLLRYVHNSSKLVLPRFFEGGFLSLRKQINSNWIVGQTIDYSTVSPGGYRLMALYGGGPVTPKHPYFMAEVSPSGHLCLDARVAPIKIMTVSAQTQFHKTDVISWEAICDLYLPTSTASLIALNDNHLAFHFLQAFGEKLAVGAELFMRIEKNNNLAAASGVVRYKFNSGVLSVSAGSRGLDCCYAHRLCPHITLAALLEVGFITKRNVATFAYEWKNQKWVGRASIDTEGLVGATVNHAVTRKDNIDLVCSVSGLLNHANQKFRLGVGLNAIWN